MTNTILAWAVAIGISWSSVLAQENQSPNILQLPDDCIAILNVEIWEKVYDIVQCLDQIGVNQVDWEIVDTWVSQLIEIGDRANNYLGAIQDALNEEISPWQWYDLRTLIAQFPWEMYIGKDVYWDGNGQEFQYIDRFWPHVVLESWGYNCTSWFSTLDQSKTTTCDRSYLVSNIWHLPFDECSRVNYGLQMTLKEGEIDIENWQRLNIEWFECFWWTGSEKL